MKTMLRKHWRQFFFWGGMALAFFMVWFLQRLPFEHAEMTEAGDALIYQPSSWWSVIFVMAALAGSLIGTSVVTLPHWWARVVGGLAYFFAVSILVVAVPRHGRLEITPTGFSHTAGFWWAPETKSFHFADLSLIRLTREQSEEPLPTFAIEICAKNADKQVLPLSTVLEAGLGALYQRAERLGVMVFPRDGVVPRN